MAAPDRKAMDRALKAIVVPKIRSKGFSGRWPRFRRERGAEFQMIMIMFDKYGGSFCIEAGSMSHAEFLEKQRQWKKHGKELSKGELTAAHCGVARRRRLGADELHADRWFQFGPRDYEVAAGEERRLMPPEFYSRIARDALSAVARDLDRFFSAT